MCLSTRILCGPAIYGDVLQKEIFPVTEGWKFPPVGVIMKDSFRMTDERSRKNEKSNKFAVGRGYVVF